MNRDEQNFLMWALSSYLVCHYLNWAALMAWWLMILVVRRVIESDWPW